MKNKKKSRITNIALFLTTLFLCFIFAEIGIRIILFSEVSFLNNIPIISKQRNTHLYADPNSEDDYWRLECKVNKTSCVSPKPHPLLGWIIERSAYASNLQHKNAAYIGSRRPVLLYGDSFARCVGTCFQDILNNDADFSNDYYLLNYGMDGYGLDQIYLLFKTSVDHYRNPLIVISLMTLDLDRSILSYRGAQKPYFIVENSKLKLVENSINTDPAVLLSNNEPQITSYLYRRILFSEFVGKHLPNRFISYLKKENYYKKKKIEVNEKIIVELLNELRSRNLDYVFLIFHPSWTPEARSQYFKDGIDWRDSFLRQKLEEYNVPYIWSKDVIAKSKQNDRSRNAFYQEDGHPSADFNKLIAEEIKQYVIRHKTYKINHHE